MKDTIYITTPIYYVNDAPHIGHAYTTIAADVVSRYYRMQGKKVFFLTGTDEHGQKIEHSAHKKGVDIKKFVDDIVVKYKELWEVLNISYDGFIRTTDEKHIKTVQKIFSFLYEKGDIYKGEYEGWYCTPCESYCLETDIENKHEKKCPDCGKEISRVKEDAYFFKLSKYEQVLLDFYEKNKDFLLPSSRAKEMINFIKQGLRDLCVSRTLVKWAVPVPFDNEHFVYVWFDALINYVSAINYLDKDKKFLSLWPADVHFVGKEIFKFHTIIWPAMLFALGLEPPKKVFGHGWWTVEGEKMSKSKGNVVDPKTIVKEYNEDVLRYFLLREVPFGNDGDFSIKGLINRYNSELANDLGNLASRVLKMIIKYCHGKVPEVDIKNNILWDKIKENSKKYNYSMQNEEFCKALISVWDVINEANKYVEDSAPWKLAKDTENQAALYKVLFELVATIRIIAIRIYPFMPRTAEKLWHQLGLKGIPINSNWEDFPGNLQIGEVELLFPRKQ